MEPVYALAKATGKPLTSRSPWNRGGPPTTTPGSVPRTVSVPPPAQPVRRETCRSPRSFRDNSTSKLSRALFATVLCPAVRRNRACGSGRAPATSASASICRRSTSGRGRDNVPPSTEASPETSQAEPDLCKAPRKLPRPPTCARIGRNWLRQARSSESERARATKGRVADVSTAQPACGVKGQVTAKSTAERLSRISVRPRTRSRLSDSETAASTSASCQRFQPTSRIFSFAVPAGLSRLPWIWAVRSACPRNFSSVGIQARRPLRSRASAARKARAVSPVDQNSTCDTPPGTAVSESTSAKRRSLCTSRPPGLSTS